MQDLRGKKLVLLGFTLFSMFFGAGNLIFPPHLGAQAGANLWSAFAGFAVSAIGLPIMGVAAVANAGGLDRLASRVHPKFALAFAILVYLSIGPCLAIPRTASTSFEMLVPLLGGGRGLQLGYSVVFFTAAFLVALRPEKETTTLADLRLNAERTQATIPFVLDGQILDDNLHWCGKDRAWLERTVEANTLLVEEILLLIGNDTEDYFLLKKQPRRPAGKEKP